MHIYRSSSFIPSSLFVFCHFHFCEKWKYWILGLLLWEEDDGGDTQATQLVGKCPQPHHYYGLDCYVCLYVVQQHLQVDGPKTYL